LTVLNKIIVDQFSVFVTNQDSPKAFKKRRFRRDDNDDDDDEEEEEEEEEDVVVVEFLVLFILR